MQETLYHSKWLRANIYWNLYPNAHALLGRQRRDMDPLLNVKMEDKEGLRKYVRSSPFCLDGEFFCPHVIQKSISLNFLWYGLGIL